VNILDFRKLVALAPRCYSVNIVLKHLLDILVNGSNLHCLQEREYKGEMTPPPIEETVSAVGELIKVGTGAQGKVWHWWSTGAVQKQTE